MSIFGKYVLEEEIGKGGMGIVYRATDLRLGRIAALKELVLSHSVSEQEKKDVIARFNQEAQTAASLNHPNVITVFDVGEENGKHYIAMEYLPGKTLKDYLDEDYKFKYEEITDILIQIASGLEHAHSKGVVHRDIKPDNMKILSDNVIKITDFGIARIESSTSNLTQDGTMLGTLGYISPEQLHNSKGVDSRADIFSFGAMMYEIFTKKLPFDGGTIGSTILKIMTDEPVEPRKINPEIPEIIEKVILKCLQKDPNKRYQKLKEVIQELTMFKFMLTTPAMSAQATKEVVVPKEERNPNESSLKVTNHALKPNLTKTIPGMPMSQASGNSNLAATNFDTPKNNLAATNFDSSNVFQNYNVNRKVEAPQDVPENKSSILKQPSFMKPDSSLTNTFSSLKNSQMGMSIGAPDAGNEISVSFLRSIGKMGVAKGQLSSPRGVAVSPQGMLFVADTQNRRVQVFDSMGTWQFIIQNAEMQSPCDIAFDSSGKLYILDSVDCKIRVFDASSGGLLSSFGSRGSSPGQIKSGTGMTILNDKIYVADNEGFRIMAFSLTGQSLSIFGKYGERPGEYKNPYSLTSDGSKLYVLDYGLARVQVLDKDGISRLVFGQRGTTKGQFSIPKGIGVDRFGRIFICDTLNHRVQVFEKAGKWIYSFGSKGNGPGQFTGPEAMTITNDGNIYIVDKGNSRVQVFTYEN